MGSRVPPANGASKFGFQKLENRVTIQLTSRSNQEMREIKRKLVSELDLVRILVKKIEEMDRNQLGVDAEVSNKLFKNCGTLLEKLMKHKHGWVFNKPVDPLALGLTDYFDIIKHPMDLGTVKSRLDKNWYNSPMEFAEDVRLTFHNAMTYNPKVQDVHAMAELLLTFFEEKWKLLEVSKLQPLKVPKLGKISSLKKPKAKELDKREMTYEEKQNLSINLQNLPSEKLDHVVQIIKKRTPLLSQKEDEIEVDIDTFDSETLWELDRFVNNYKKGLINNKRKAEFPNQDVIDIEPNMQDNITPVVIDAPKEAISPVQMEKQIEENVTNGNNKSSSSRSSSSVSGSSSSDSDSGSSCGTGSDAGH